MEGSVLYPLSESKDVPEFRLTSPPASSHTRRTTSILKRNCSESDILGPPTNKNEVLSPVDKCVSKTTDNKMDKMPHRRASAYTATMDSSAALHLSSPARQSTSLLPNVVEKFNFGLKEQLRKANKVKEELQAKHQEILQSFESVSNENESLKSSRSVLEEDKKVLESRYRKLKSLADVMKADYDRVNAKLANLEVANEGLKQTSWIRQSRRGKGSSAVDSHDGVESNIELFTLKEDLVKKDVRIGELEKEVISVQEKLKQALLESESSKPIQIMVEYAGDADIDTGHKAVSDEATLSTLDRPSILVEYKRLLASYNSKELELKSHQDQILNLEKACNEQRKELLILKMEVSKANGGNNVCVVSSSNSELHHSPRSSSVTVLGVPSSVVKSASFDNGRRRISLPVRKEAAGSPDVSVLQNCLKLSLAEKKSLEEEVRELKEQLSSMRHGGQSSLKSSRSLSVVTLPSHSKLNTSKSNSPVVSPSLVEDTEFFASKSSKEDLLQLALAEKKTLSEENEMLRGNVVEWKKKAESLETQMAKLEKLVPKSKELNELKALLHSLEKKNHALLDNEKTMNGKVKSLDEKNSQLCAVKAQLLAENQKLNQQLTKLNEKERQQRGAEKQHKDVQTSERPIERIRPGSADSKGTTKVTFYRTSSQSSEPDVQADNNKKVQVSEGQAPEMKVAHRLNIASRSPTASPSGEKHPKTLHVKSLSADSSVTKSSGTNRLMSDSADLGTLTESVDNKYLSSSQPAGCKPAVTSVKVSTSIKKETPTKINALGALHLRMTSPQLPVSPSTSSHAQAHSIASQSHAPSAASLHSITSPVSSNVSTVLHTRTKSGGGGATSPGFTGNNALHSVQSNASVQKPVSHATTSHVTPAATIQSSVTSSSPSSSAATKTHSVNTGSLSSSMTTQSFSVAAAHQTSAPAKPRPFLKSNTTMSFVTTSKPTGSPSHSPLVAQKSSSSSTIPSTLVTAPLKSTSDNSHSSDVSKPPLQKMSSLTVGGGSEVVRRRSKSRTQQSLDPMKRSSAYFPMDVTSQSIMEENELHRCGSLESLKSALFQAVSAKVHPSVASSSVSTASNAVSVSTTSAATTSMTTSFSPPTPKLVSFAKVHSSENKFETKPAEARKEVKFSNSEQATARARPRATRHQSINNQLPPVSSYHTPSMPKSSGTTETSSTRSSQPADTSNSTSDGKLRRSNTTGSTSLRPTKKTLLLRWCQKVTEEYKNVDIRNFSDSFSDGLAFCAIVHHFSPARIPYHTLNSKTREQNFQLAFDAAEAEGIPQLLDVCDMVSLPVPDWMSVMTYVGCIHQHFMV